MKFLADENVPQAIIRFIQSQNHSVVDSKQHTSGVADRTLLAIAQKEHRILVTYDKDFIVPVGETPKTSLVILRFPRTQPTDTFPAIAQLLKKLEKKNVREPFQIILSRDTIDVTEFRK